MNPEYVALALALAQQMIQLASDLHAGKISAVDAKKALDGVTSLHQQLAAQDAMDDAEATAKFGG